jgi:hypothetical protein
MVTIHIATEDELSEAVALKLVARVPGLEHGLLLRRGGNGYLRSRMPQWSDLARRQPVLVLTDLDTLTCPSALIGSWLGGRLPSTGLLLRVAVRTIEAWLLADEAAATALLGQRASAGLPRDPDGILDPKSLLVRLASRAPRDVRLDICPARGVPARQGLGYNARLSGFVRDSWDPERAAIRSDSLRRAMVRIGEVVSRR